MTDRKRVLIIDDEPSVLDYLERLLQRLGYEVECTDNGADGLKRAANPGIDLIISDMFMPGDPCQLELIRRLRECRSDCPLVVITGHPSADIMQDCRQIGVNEFLTKPFELSFIKNVLNKLLLAPTKEISA